MERVFDIAFRINGNLDGSFGSAISEAQRQMQNLMRQISAGSQRNLSQAARAAQNLERLYSMRNAINQYKNLTQNVQANSAALMQARLRTAQLRQEHERQIRQTEQMQQAYDRLKAVYQENQRSMSADERVTWQAQLRAAREELQEQRRRESAAGSAATGSNRESERLTQRLQQQRQQLEALRTSLQSAGVSLSDMAAHEQELEDAIARTTQELERQQHLETLRQRQSDAAANFSNAFGNFQNSIATAQSIMAPFTDAVKVSMDFNKAMSEVQAITASTGEQFDKLKAKAKELGASTMFSASDVALGMKELGKSGFNADQIDASIASNLNLAAAGELDLATSSKILSDALTMFKVPLKDYAKESEHFADVMAKSANSSNTSVELIGETMKYAGAVAGSMGYSFNDAAIATTLMAKVGLNGSMAGTALRSTFTRLVAPPKDAAEALDKLGVSAVNADGTLKPFRETLGELRTAFKNLSEADKATFAKDIAGLEAMSGFLAMVDADEQTYLETIQAIDNSQGTALQTAKEKTDNLAGAVTTFQSAFEGLQIALGDAFEDPLKNLVNSVAGNLGAFAQFVNEHKELAQAAGIAAAAISAVIVAVAGYGAAAAGVEYLSTSFAFLRANLAGLGITARISSAMALASTITWSGMFTAITAKAAAARVAVTGFFASLSVSSVASSIASIGSAFMTAAKGAMTFAFSPVGIALMALAAAGYYVYTHWSQVAPVFQNLASVIGGALSTAIQTLSPALESLSSSTSRLGPAFAQIGRYAFMAFALVANVVVRVAALIITSFANAIKTVVELFSGLGNAIASFLAGDFSKAGEHLSNTLSKTVENVKKTFSDGFSGAVDVAKNLDVPLKLMSADNQTQAAAARHAVHYEKPAEVDTGKIVEIIAATFKNVTQEQNKDADLSKISDAIKATVDAVKQDPKTDIAPLLQQVSTAIESVKKENPEADTAKLEAVISASMKEISAAQAQQAEQKTVETETTQQNLDNVGQAAGETAAQLQGTQGNIQAFDSALPQPIGNLGILSDSSGTAGGSLQAMADAAGAVASALSSKAAEIGNIKISVPQISAAPVAQNFAGGIYSKGAFLTTFAEKSPEAAIPIDKSQRAIDLWTKTGQMLGLLQGNSTAIESPPTGQKMTTLERAQRRRLEQVKAQYEAAVKMSNVELGMSNEKLHSTLPTPHSSLQYDELGNIKGLNGLKDNVITKDDDIQVARAKKSAQMAEWRKNVKGGMRNEKFYSDRINSPFPIPNSPLFSGRRNLPDLSNIPMTQTQAQTYDTGLNIGDLIGMVAGDGGGILSAITDRISASSGEGIIPSLLNNLPQQSESSPIDLHFEINIQGNANAEDVENGIRQSIPMLEETFERKLANFKHEQQRRSF